MSAKKMDTEIRQEQIVHAALGLIAQRGLRQLSVARIARQVGLVPSAIYRHYKSKDDVIDAILDQVRRKLLDNVRLVCGETSDPVECLHRLLFLHVQLIRENKSLPRVIFSEEIYTGHSERRRKVYDTISAYLEQVAVIVRRGQTLGVIRAEMPPPVVAVIFLGLIQPAAILWQMSDGEFDVTKHAEKAWEIFQASITRPADTTCIPKQESVEEGSK